MNVKLIDVDSKIPNLALMQISGYHKRRGDRVGFGVEEPDLVYISCVFTKNGPNARGIRSFFHDAEVFEGGSGISNDWLPPDMQKEYPDYSLYDMDYSLGFTTRGCIRNCPFCIVPRKEGPLHRWQHVKDFHNPDFDKVKLLDNNVYADKKWFYNNTDWILDHDLKVDITQGMDVRLLSAEIAVRLKELGWFSTLHFAFDAMKDEKAVREGIGLLKEVGFNVRQQVQFYVLVGFDTTPEEDKYRCRLLKELGTNPFVMPFVKNRWTSRIARWANRKWLFWSCDIDEYKYGVGE